MRGRLSTHGRDIRPRARESLESPNQGERTAREAAHAEGFQGIPELPSAMGPNRGRSNQITTRERRVGQRNRTSRRLDFRRRHKTGDRKYPVLHGRRKGREKRDFSNSRNLHRERCRRLGKPELARLRAGSFLMFFASVVVAAERSEVGTIPADPLDIMVDIKTGRRKRLTQGHLSTCRQKGEKEGKE